MTSLVPIQSQPEPGWGKWTDVPADERVTYMESLIASNHHFKKHLWPGGDRSGPILIYKPPKEEPELKRHVLKPRKTLNKPPSSCKQRRISSYFNRTASTTNPNDKILEMLSTVATQVFKLRKDHKALRQLLKRRKSRTHSRRTAFHTAISGRKKANLAHIGCQTNTLHQNLEDPAIGMVFSVLSSEISFSVLYWYVCVSDFFN